MNDVKRLSRQLRSCMTDAERGLWSHLRSRQLGGVKFRRQVPLGPYIVDFASFETRIVIELDGGQHAEAAHRIKDTARDAYLRSQGFHVLRFWNHDVMSNIEGVLVHILQVIRSDAKDV